MLCTQTGLHVALSACSRAVHFPQGHLMACPVHMQPALRPPSALMDHPAWAQPAGCAHSAGVHAPSVSARCIGIAGAVPACVPHVCKHVHGTTCHGHDFDAGSSIRGCYNVVLNKPQQASTSLNKPLAGVVHRCSIGMARYVSFVGVNNAQSTAKTFPEHFNEATITQEDMYIVELDLIAIDPSARTATFLLELVLGGNLGHETESRVLDLDGNSLAIKIGHQSLLFDSGDVVAGQSVSRYLLDIALGRYLHANMPFMAKLQQLQGSYTAVAPCSSPQPFVVMRCCRFNYPFDTYTLDMAIYCFEVDSSNSSDVCLRVLMQQLFKTYLASKVGYKTMVAYESRCQFGSNERLTRKRGRQGVV
eukprot:365303-Chlamydomonas_euryale.AAC.55